MGRRRVLIRSAMFVDVVTKREVPVLSEATCPQATATPVVRKSNSKQGCQNLGQKWDNFASNGTNLGLLKISFQYI